MYMNKHAEMWKKNMKKIRKKNNRSLPWFDYANWVRTFGLFIKSLTILVKRTIRISLYNRPMRAKRTTPVGDPPVYYIIKSRGKIEMKSIQNQPFKYFRAISFLLVIS